MRGLPVEATVGAGQVTLGLSGRSRGAQAKAVAAADMLDLAAELTVAAQGFFLDSTHQYSVWKARLHGKDST